MSAGRGEKVRMPELPWKLEKIQIATTVDDLTRGTEA
jgi:hypothetical protein